MKTSHELQDYIKLVLDSYRKYTGETLATDLDELYNANFVSASHYFYKDGTRFIFGNKKALELWEMDWDEFIGKESHYTANEDQRQERAKLLDDVKKHGIIKNYSGLRVSKSGREFIINNAIVWNVDDHNGKIIGQAVKFDDFEYI